MHRKVINLLNNLNRTFYDDLAEIFTASRGTTEPGLERVFAQIQPGARVLDLGCGQGRVAAMLPAGCEYTGIDFSTEMLAIAERSTNGELFAVAPRFITGDLLDPTWPALVPGSYDWIILRAVLHHIPGAENRQAIVKYAAGRLASAGRLLLANWQFLEIERLRRRLLPWDVVGLSPDDVEPGDYLLNWQREGYGIRYVHWIDEDETDILATHAGLTIESQFRADGHHNNLTLYAVLRIT
ncbi:MAG: class I SAM-dependent methyltransferase [Anaerolineae bacterium]|nr:class I SAM-dependent methyltransferase [Anaerolineae bacterium]